MKRSLTAAVVALAAWLSSACSRPCASAASCNGQVLETCTPGSGLVGPQIQSQDCTQAFATCIDPGDGGAFCAEDPCTVTEFLAADGGILPFETNCVGNVLFACSAQDGDAGFVQGLDCTTVPADIYGDPSVCVDNGGGNAGCAP